MQVAFPNTWIWWQDRKPTAKFQYFLHQRTDKRLHKKQIRKSEFINPHRIEKRHNLNKAKANIIICKLRFGEILATQTSHKTRKLLVLFHLLPHSLDVLRHAVQFLENENRNSPNTHRYRQTNNLIRAQKKIEDKITSTSYRRSGGVCSVIGRRGFRLSRDSSQHYCHGKIGSDLQTTTMVTVIFSLSDAPAERIESWAEEMRYCSFHPISVEESLSISLFIYFFPQSIINS